jgi:TolB protein
LVVAGSVLLGCGDAPTGGGALLPPAAPPPPPPPPSSEIAFESRRDGIVDIYVMNADGRVQTNLTNNNLTNNPADDLRPAWSPGT